MEGTIAEIRGFAGNFAPRSWAYCDGRILAISEYTALFSLIGTYYGGDGRSTVGLPDLRGRVPIGAGSSPGTSTYPLGYKGGLEQESLTAAQLPAHTHTATPSLTVTGTAAGDVSQPCYNETGDPATPGGNVPAKITSGYMEAGEADATLAPAQASLAVTGNVTGNIIVGSTGSGQPFYNVQPYQAINWIICLDGVFPQRN
jgi:microcystin-dependent protein